jgi:hypothetical protein
MPLSRNAQILVSKFIELVPPTYERKINTEYYRVHKHNYEDTNRSFIQQKNLSQTEFEAVINELYELGYLIEIDFTYFGFNPTPPINT